MNTGDNGGNVIMTRLGKVGIGTEILDEKLNVFGAGKFYGTGDNYIKIWFNGAHGNIESNEDILLNFYSGKNVVIGGESPWSSHPTGDLYANHNAYLAKINGSVGIGTITTSAKLHINANTQTGEIIQTNHGLNYGYGLICEVGNNSGTNGNNTKALVVKKSTGSLPEVENFIVYGSGEVWARKVYIRNTPDWSDYIFEKDYKLMPISELEIHKQKQTFAKNSNI